MKGIDFDGNDVLYLGLPYRGKKYAQMKRWEHFMMIRFPKLLEIIMDYNTIEDTNLKNLKKYI